MRGKNLTGIGSIVVVTVSSLPGRGCLDASRWSSFPVPVCFLMVPRNKQRITGSLLVVRVPLFPATSRLLPGTGCAVIEAVYELSTSGCIFVDATPGIQGTGRWRPGTLRCLTGPMTDLPASPRKLPGPLRLLRYTTSSLPWMVRLEARTVHSFLGTLRFQLGAGSEGRVAGRAGAVQATGFVGTRSNLSRSPRRLSRSAYSGQTRGRGNPHAGRYHVLRRPCR